MKIANVDDNMKIVSIGAITKRENRTQWTINLELEKIDGYIEQPKTDENTEEMAQPNEGIEQTTKTYKKKQRREFYTQISNLPAIARNRIINPIDGNPRKVSYKINLSNISTSNFNSVFKNGTHYFMHEAHGIYDEDGIDKLEIYIPKLEFARVLFFWSAYTARNCLENNFLAVEFDIERQSAESALINVQPHATCALRNFQFEGFRRMLAWILLDKNARESYESISRNYSSQKNKENQEWLFNFEPPVLNNLSLSLSGRKTKSKATIKEYYVYEIIKIKGIDVDLPEHIDFFSDNFRSGWLGSNVLGSDDSVMPTTVPVQDDNEEANYDTEQVEIELPETFVEFSESIRTKKVAKKTTTINVPAQSDVEYDEDEVEKEFSVNTGEQSIFGQVTRAEFSTSIDVDNNEKHFSNAFELFKTLITSLKSRHQFLVSEINHKFSPSKRYMYSTFRNGNPRTMLEYRIDTGHGKFIICEVNTSHTKRKLTTLVMKVDDFNAWHTYQDEFLYTIVKKSLSWPRKELQRFGNIKTINHPKNIENVESHSVVFDNWLKRFELRLGY